MKGDVEHSISDDHSNIKMLCRTELANI